MVTFLILVVIVTVLVVLAKSKQAYLDAEYNVFESKYGKDMIILDNFSDIGDFLVYHEDCRLLKHRAESTKNYKGMTHVYKFLEMYPNSKSSKIFDYFSFEHKRKKQ